MEFSALEKKVSFYLNCQHIYCYIGVLLVVRPCSPILLEILSVL